MADIQQLQRQVIEKYIQNELEGKECGMWTVLESFT